MKNYCLNKKYYKNFILNYIVLNNTIIINKADKSVECIPYTIENEKLILEIMKEQVLNSKKFSTLLNKKFEIFLKLFLDEILLLFLLFIANFNIPIIYSNMILISSLGIISLTTYKLIKYQTLRNDLKKHLLFITNEKTLNKEIRTNPKSLKKLDTKLKNKILTKEKTNFSFSFNTIDNITYKELNQIYNHIEQTNIHKKTKKKSN